MRSSLPLGRILGFPVDVHFTLLILLGLVLVMGGGVVGLVLVVLTFASVLAHELGHSVVARRVGVPIAGITLYPFGGMAKMAAPPRTGREEILIAAAGPAVSLALAIAFGLVFLLTGIGLVGELALVNGILGVFNLIPALPMDGGRIFRAVLAGRMGFLPATRLSTRIARWIAAAMALAAIFAGPMLLLVAAVVWWMAGAELKMAEAEAYPMPTMDPDLEAMMRALRRRAAGEAVYRARPTGPEAPQSAASRMVVDVDPVRP